MRLLPAVGEGEELVVRHREQLPLRHRQHLLIAHRRPHLPSLREVSLREVALRLAHRGAQPAPPRKLNAAWGGGGSAESSGGRAAACAPASEEEPQQHREEGGQALPAAPRSRRPAAARRLQWQGGPQWPRGRERPPPTRRPASLHRQLTKEWGRSRARGRPSHAHPAASRTAPSCPRGALARAHSCGLGKGRGARAAAFRRGRPMSHRQKQRRPTDQGRAGTIRRRGICLAAFPRAPGVWRRGGKTGRHGMSPRLYISCRQWLEAADKNRGFSDRGRGRAAGGP